MTDRATAVPIPVTGGASTALPVVPPFSVRQVLPWLVFAGLLLLVGLYFVSAEEGATALFAGNAVHEWVHDGRHLLGFPCH
jgi:putative cobalt transporter subunit CbtB